MTTPFNSSCNDAIAMEKKIIIIEGYKSHRGEEESLLPQPQCTLQNKQRNKYILEIPIHQRIPIPSIKEGACVTVGRISFDYFS